MNCDCGFTLQLTSKPLQNSDVYSVGHNKNIFNLTLQVQISHPTQAKSKFPTPGQEKLSNAQNMPGGNFKLRIDRHMTRRQILGDVDSKLNAVVSSVSAHPKCEERLLFARDRSIILRYGYCLLTCLYST